MNVYDFGHMVFIISVVVVIAFILIIRSLCNERRDKISAIDIGMSESDMLYIMGGRPNKSLLKDNRVKYEWRYQNGYSAGSTICGVRMRGYSGVKKVTIYCKDGLVEEVKPFNI